MHYTSLCLKGICCSQNPSAVLLFQQRFFICSPPLAYSVAVIDNLSSLMASSGGQVAPPTGNSMSALQNGEAVTAKLGMWLALRIEVQQENWSPARRSGCFMGTGVRGQHTWTSLDLSQWYEEPNGWWCVIVLTYCYIIHHSYSSVSLVLSLLNLLSFSLISTAFPPLPLLKFVPSLFLSDKVNLAYFPRAPLFLLV